MNRVPVKPLSLKSLLLVGFGVLAIYGAEFLPTLSSHHVTNQHADLKHYPVNECELNDHVWDVAGQCKVPETPSLERR